MKKRSKRQKKEKTDVWNEENYPEAFLMARERSTVNGLLKMSGGDLHTGIKHDGITIIDIKEINGVTANTKKTIRTELGFISIRYVRYMFVLQGKGSINMINSYLILTSIGLTDLEAIHLQKLWCRHYDVMRTLVSWSLVRNALVTIGLHDIANVIEELLLSPEALKTKPMDPPLNPLARKYTLTE